MTGVEKIKYVLMIGCAGAVLCGGINMYRNINVLEEELNDKNRLLSELSETLDNLNADVIEYELKLKDMYEYTRELETEMKNTSLVNYNSQDLTVVSNATEQQLYEALDGTNMKNLSGCIIEAEKEYGVNALFLTALIAHETGYGTSRRYIEDNNVGGYEVYTPSAKGRTFNSKESSVYAVANLLSTHYLSSEGKYYNGTSSYAVNINYCATSKNGQFEWHRTIDKIANDLKEEILENQKGHL